MSNGSLKLTRRTALAGALPSGVGTIEMDGDVVTITIRWDETWDKDNSGAPGTVSLRTQL